LPLVVRTIGNAAFRKNLHRLCIVGIFTVMVPYVIEVISVTTSTQLLLERFYWSYPMALLMGVLGSIVLANLKPFGEVPGDTRARYAVITIAKR